MGDGILALLDPTYGFPSSEVPFYHLHVAVAQSLTSNLHVSGARFDGRPIRDFWVYNDGKPSPTNEVRFAAHSSVVVRVDWFNSGCHRLELEFADGGGGLQLATCEAEAPDWGGYWNADWRSYSATVVTDPHGLARSHEPVHLLLSVYSNYVSEPASEVRVVAIDPLTGDPSVVPCQVFGVSSQSETIDDGALPSTTFEVAFLADLSSSASKVFLVFYNNPQAAAPEYDSDLHITGDSLNLTIENNYYRVKLHSKSGQLDEILLKQGVNAIFDHHVETNGAMHWNPDIYAPPRIWSHASDWDPPTNVETISGPIFFSIQRWGPLPDYPDVICSVTYTFYAHQPYIVMESVIDILADLDVRALRNGEIVINLKVAREYAWKEPNGRISTVLFEDRPQEPRRAVDIPAQSTWWAFINREKRAALAAIVLDSSAYRRAGGLARVEPYITMKWGEWAYCVRPLAYTYNSHNPQRLVRVPLGSIFCERIAFLPIRLGIAEDELFAPIDAVAERLLLPAVVGGPEMAIDERTPAKWGVTFPPPVG